MKVCFRADASVRIGTGHVMRCLTLAEGVRARGAAVSFICRELPGNLCEFLEGKGFRLERLPLENSFEERESDIGHAGWLGVAWERDATESSEIISRLPGTDWLVIDHYSLDKRWESRLRPLVKRVMVIDDIADRPHDCDLLLDQNLYEDMDTRYTTLVPKSCIALLGPKYSILRSEFISARKHLRLRNGSTRRILVFFGGSDIENATERTLRAIRMLDRPEIAVDVVAGHSSPDKQKIKDLCESMANTTFHCQVSNMAELISEADLAIGAAGTTTWERCCLGLPSLVVSLARNQERIAQETDRVGFGTHIKSDIFRSTEKLKNQIERIIDSPDILRAQSRKGIDLVDGLGVKRILRYLLDENNEQKEPVTG